jgi:hypothetical protein
VQMEAPFTKEAFLNAPIILFLQIQSIVKAARRVTIDSQAMARQPSLLAPTLDTSQQPSADIAAATPSMSHAMVVPMLGKRELPASPRRAASESTSEHPTSSLSPTTGPLLISAPKAAKGPVSAGSTDIGRPSQAPQPAYPQAGNAHDLRIGSSKSLTDAPCFEGEAHVTDAAVSQDRTTAKMAAEVEKRDPHATDRSTDTVRTESGAQGSKTEDFVATCPKLHVASASAFSTDPQHSQSQPATIEVASQPTRAAGRPSLRELVHQAGLHWPREVAAAGCAEVHLDVHEVRQRMARSFVSTRSLSDSHSIFISLANDPLSRIPLALSASARIISRFQASGTIVRPSPVSVLLAPPPGLNKFASFASLPSALPSLSSGIPSLPLSSVQSLGRTLSPEITPRDAGLHGESPQISTALGPAVTPIMAALQTAAGTYQASSALLNTMPTTSTAAPLPREAESIVGGDTRGCVAPGNPKDAMQHRGNRERSISQGSLVAARAAEQTGQLGIAQAAAGLRVDGEVREMAMQCLAIPDDLQLRPPVPFKCSHVPSRAHLPHIDEVVRQPDKPAALRCGPHLVADLLAAMPSAPSWRRGSQMFAVQNGKGSKEARATEDKVQAGCPVSVEPPANEESQVGPACMQAR